MGDVPPQPQHDADVGARRDAQGALTRSPARGAVAPAPPRRAAFALVLAAFAVLVGLGVWQVERRAWKHDLIARVEARVRAPPTPAPGPAGWAAVGPGDAYRHVALTGTFLHDRETLVQAVIGEGPGFWVVTPLARDDGTHVLVNRGFVPADRRDPATRAAGQIAGPVAVTGLLRLTEPGGGFLRANAPREGRWYSRDVAAIAFDKGLAADKGLSDTAPYFVDADAAPANPGGLPVGGRTVIAFADNHAVYAATWFAMALMLAGAVLYARLKPARAEDEG